MTRKRNLDQALNGLRPPRDADLQPAEEGKAESDLHRRNSGQRERTLSGPAYMAILDVSGHLCARSTAQR
jgi:acyl-coenzyme A thioesterase PaaI-like protein